MFDKGFKTTVVAIIGGVLGISTFIFWYIGKVDNQGLTIGLASVASFTSTLGLLLAKDSDKSHTQNDYNIQNVRNNFRLCQTKLFDICKLYFITNFRCSTISLETIRK